MNIFNSLGSNYNLGYLLNSIYLTEKNGKRELVTFLENKYQGQVTLFYKGREAITQALLLADLPDSSKVALTGFTCIAVVDAIKKAHMNPVFLDIDPEKLHFDTQTLEAEIKRTPTIKAVIIQNTLGYPCDIEGIQKICKKHKILLIEDLAHSIGTSYSTKKEAGSVGDYVVLSFSQDKVVDAVSGGALISKPPHKTLQNTKTNTDISMQDKIYPLMTLLIRKTYKSGIGKFLHIFLKTTRLLSNPMKNDVGKNMSDWHAMLALQEFGFLEKQLSHRRTISKIYADTIHASYQFKEISSLVSTSTCLRFPVKITNRNEFITYAKTQGLYISDIWYDAPVAPKRLLKKSGFIMGTCPESEKISEVIINLPTHVNVTKEKAVTISQIVNTWHTQQK